MKLLGIPIIKNDHIVKPNEEYMVHFVQPDISTSIEPNYDIKLDIVYGDEDIIVLSKQSGLTVHPGAGINNDTLLNAVIAHLDVRPSIVHRLDKDTSGLMVIAKNEEAHSFLSELLSNRKVKREYLAVVWGTLSTQQRTIKTNIAPKRGYEEMMCVTKITGKLAITHYVHSAESYRTSKPG